MRIYSRAEWGATLPDGAGPAPLPAREVWLHHSASTAPPAGGSVQLDALAIRFLEAVGHGRFGQGISYTFLVCPSGRVFEGHSPNRLGAHLRDRNSIARAICLVGDYDTGELTERQEAAVADLLRHGHGLGWWVAPRLAGGHRDAPGARTACPGRHGHAAIGRINRAAAPSPTPRATEDALSWTRDEGAPAVPDLYRDGLAPLPDPRTALAWATANAAHARDRAAEAVAEVRALRQDVAQALGDRESAPLDYHALAAALLDELAARRG